MVSVKSFMVPAEKFVVVDCETSARRAAELMRDRRIGSVFVARDREVIGILTETDFVRRLVAVGLDWNQTPVEHIMSAPILAIDENKGLLDASELMAQKRIRHLGVSRDGELVGIISVRDLVVSVANIPRKWIMGAGGRHILAQIYGRA